MPYISATGSGIIQIANSFNKPTVATKVGCFPGIIEDGKTGYLVEPKDPFSIASAVIKYYDTENCDEFFTKSVSDAKERFSWDRMVKEIESFEI